MTEARPQLVQDAEFFTGPKPKKPPPAQHQLQMPPRQPPPSTGNRMDVPPQIQKYASTRSGVRVSRFFTAAESDHIPETEMGDEGNKEEPQVMIKCGMGQGARDTPKEP